MIDDRDHIYMRVFRYVTALAVSVSLAMTTVLPAQAAPVAEPQTVCPPESGVGIDDFVVWVDSPGGSDVNVPLEASPPCPIARTITFNTYDITATAGVDYVGVTSGTVTINAGSTSATIQIRVLKQPPTGVEPKFGVQLTAGAKFDDPDATITITSP